MIGTHTEPGIRRVWAWCGRSIYTDRRNVLVRRAAKLKLTDVCVTGNSIKDGVNALPTRARLVETIQALQAEGIAAHVLWFPWPTVAAATRAAQVLGELAALGLRSTQLDLEENWTQHKRPDYPAATAAFFDTYERLTDVPVGVTGIPFHSVTKLGEAIRRSAYVATQGYSSNRLGYLPGHVQRTAHARWRGYGKPVVAGLAAYGQEGAGGMPAARAVATAVEAVRALTDPAVSEVAWWSLVDLAPGTAARDAAAQLTAAIS